MQKMEKNNPTSVIRKIWSSTWFAILVLCLLMFTEWYSLKHFQYTGHGCNCFLDSKYPYIILLLWIILSAITITGLSVRVYVLSKFVVRKFLTNALGMRWIAFAFILAFLVHISWISDVLYQLIVKDSGSFVQFGFLFLGMIILIIIFPQSNEIRKQIPDDEKTLLISGISAEGFSIRNLDLFVKPFLGEQNSGYGNIQDVVIFLSDYVFQGYRMGRERMLTPEELSDKIRGSLTAMLEVVNKTYLREDFHNVDDLTTLLKDSIWEYDFNRFKDILGELVLAYIKTNRPHYADKTVKIYFSKMMYDYDNFEECYTNLGALVRDYEKKLSRGTSGTLMHINPGTNILSSVISLYAIKANRSLLYTNQKTGNIQTLDYDLRTTSSVIVDLIEEYEES